MAKAKVLIVDDAAFMRTILKGILSQNDFEVVGEACDGKEAVIKYNELNPDITTMDITMPELDGIQALRQIKECNPSAIVVMCSAMGQQAMVIESIQNGAKDFIVKPFDAARVVDALRKAVA